MAQLTYYFHKMNSYYFLVVVLTSSSPLSLPLQPASQNKHFKKAPRIMGQRSSTLPTLTEATPTCKVNLLIFFFNLYLPRMYLQEIMPQNI